MVVGTSQILRTLISHSAHDTCSASLICRVGECIAMNIGQSCRNIIYTTLRHNIVNPFQGSNPFSQQIMQSACHNAEDTNQAEAEGHFTSLVLLRNRLSLLCSTFFVHSTSFSPHPLQRQSFIHLHFFPLIRSACKNWRTS